MAKGRRLTTSRSERMLGNYNNYGHVSYNETGSEFTEEDIWSIVEHVPDYTQHHQEANNYSSEWTPRATTESGKRRDQSKGIHVGGLSLAFDDDTSSPRRIVHQFGGGGPPQNGRHVATSAPVSVPDWSKILRVDSAESMIDSFEDDPEDDSGMVPPHEYLARSRKNNGFSVYEGVGRTLKGRDMSRVRDAVWSQTGFEG